MTDQTRVFYDGGCPVCSREIATYRTRPGADAFEWVDVQCALPGSLGPDLSREQALARMHVRTPDGSLLSGAAAFAAIWLRLPGFRWLGRLISIPPFSGIAEMGYRGFLVVRRLWRPAPSKGTGQAS
jgi:predicted DCC family thiol-disulfide oxidoreductase YuxK